MEMSAWIWFIATRVLVLSLMVPCGVIGNVTVLIIYRRDKKQSGSVYIIALALIDLFVCAVLLPHLPLYELFDYLNQGLKIYLEYAVYPAINNFFNSYLFVQVVIAVDQFIAVFRPFKHAQLRHKLNKWMLAISILILTIQNTFTVFSAEIDWQIIYTFDGILILVCLAMLVGAYTATALKLYAQRRAIRPQAQRTNDIALKTISRASDAATKAQERARTEQQPPPPAPPGKKRAMHIQALKIYTAIFLVFALTNAMAVALNMLEITYFVYVYHMKHLANPVIYYCFVNKFRNSVKEYWRRLTGR